MATDIIMADIIEVDIITIVEIDITVVTTITGVTDIITVVVIEHKLDGMDIIEIEMTTITVVDIEIIVEIITVEATITEMHTTGILIITEVLLPELPDHVRQADSIDRALFTAFHIL